MLNVLYINTTGNFSGAGVSLVQSISAMDKWVRPVVISPRGSASRYFKKHIKEVIEVPYLAQFDHTRFGRYRGVRWLVFIRELLLLPSTALHLKRVSRICGDIELIHLNEVTGIVAAVMLKRALQVPLIVHVRANMGSKHTGWRSKFLWWLFDRHVDQVICIDETVKRTLPENLKAIVIHNALTLDCDALDDGEFARRYQRLLSRHPNRVGIVGSIIRVKGVYEFVEAAISICQKRSDIVFFIVGAGVRRLRGLRGWIISVIGVAEDSEADIRNRIAQAGYTERIVMTGHIEDVRRVYPLLDILCFPSHYDAPGRPIFEAAHFGVPSIAAIHDPTPDTLVDGETGIAISAKDAAGLEAAIVRLADDPVTRRAMGARAKALAEAQFDIRKNALRLYQLYSAHFQNS
jgi:glycosyltransferase involved in cell wall biosynthesis